MKFIALIFAALATLSAAFQYNDPDPWLWIASYGLVAVLSILFFRGLRNKIIYGVLFAIYLAGAIYLWPDEYKGVTMSMSYAPEIELARESLGLGICALAFLLYLVFSLRVKQKAGGSVK